MKLKYENFAEVKCESLTVPIFWMKMGKWSYTYKYSSLGGFGLRFFSFSAWTFNSWNMASALRSSWIFCLSFSISSFLVKGNGISETFKSLLLGLDFSDIGDIKFRISLLLSLCLSFDDLFLELDELVELQDEGSLSLSRLSSRCRCRSLSPEI